MAKFAKNHPPEDFGYTPMILEEKHKMDTMIDQRYAIWFHIENNVMVIDTTINDIKYISEYLEPCIIAKNNLREVKKTCLADEEEYYPSGYLVDSIKHRDASFGLDWGKEYGESKN